MNITIERAALAKALSTVDKIVERRNTIPILGNVALYADAGRLRLVATDLDIEASNSAEAEVATPGQTTIPAALLSGIVGKLASEKPITLASQANGQVVLKAGRSRFTLQTLPIEDFPTLPAATQGHSFTLPPKLLGEMIERTRFAISTEETRYYLNGIYLHIVKVDGTSRLRAVTTDGHRLASFEIPAPEGSEAMPGVILPRKAVGEFARLAKDAEEAIDIGIAETRVTFRAGGTRLVSKLIDGVFPDYERIIPRDNDKVGTIDVEEFRRSVDLISAVASERSRTVRITLAQDRLDLAMKDAEGNDAVHSMDAEYSGPDVVISFQARYLADALAAIGGDTVELKISDGGNPAILQPRADRKLFVLIMPMRV